MNGEELGERFGDLRAGQRHMTEKIDDIASILKDHIKSEDARFDELENVRLRKIEEQLSLGRFMLLILKAVGLTVVLILTFKFGDVTSLWKAVFK